MKLRNEDYFFTPQQTIAVEPRNPQIAYPGHTHDFNEIFIVTKGNGLHIINDHPYFLCPGTICYVYSQDFHLFEKVNNLNLVNILYRETSCFDYLKNINQFFPNRQKNMPFHWLLNQFAFKKITHILNEFIQIKGTIFPHAEGLFLQLLINLQGGIYSHLGHNNNEQHIIQILRWLHLNYLQEIDWDQLTEQFEVPQRTFYRYVKNKLGLSPHTYLKKLRLFHAYSFLIKTNKSITTIAMDCHFNDSAYFSTCFKHEFGISPMKLRQ